MRASERCVSSAVVGITIATLLAVAGCQKESFERVHYERDHVSMRALDGWTQSRARGSLVFNGPTADRLDRTTIVVRSVKYDGRAAKRTHETLVKNTRTVLEALPQARVTSAEAERGTAFHVHFRSTRNRRSYERRHVVLEGSEFAFHVMLTAPSGLLTEEAVKTFNRVVDSIREES